ncbi:group III truncated hemoglobin [Marinobacter caseinilyticus]|uniref:group III truncated hemoglobin n=1 Tax=Marinobacter caseinilyticus TaxID=2692195 RepID=UPI0014093215|nr:group III truncated hemoglobin [Marinobacter caseinilyticus]
MTTMDLDNPAAIHRMVQMFYARLLDDPVMRPIFVEVAGVHLADHLPLIEGYWCKMLLGEDTYHRNMVYHHEQLHDKASLSEEHFELWFEHFNQTLDLYFDGPYTEKARALARKILHNLAEWLEERERGGDR